MGLRTLAIDPGLRHLGWALLGGRVLEKCGVSSVGKSQTSDLFLCANLHAKNLEGLCPVDRIVVERPQVYTVGKQKGDPNDLVSIAVVGALVMGLLSSGETLGAFVLPREWKGQLPKEVSHRRLARAITEDEREVLAMLPKTKIRHNGLDAVGIGLRSVGRAI